MNLSFLPCLFFEAQSNSLIGHFYSNKHSQNKDVTTKTAKNNHFLDKKALRSKAFDLHKGIKK